MLTSTKKLMFLLLILLSTAEQCTSMKARKSLMKQSTGRPKKNIVTDTKLKYLQNPSQGNIVPNMKGQAVVALPNSKPTFAQKQTNKNQPIYDQPDTANDEEYRSKSRKGHQDKVANQNEQPTKTIKKKNFFDALFLKFAKKRISDKE